MQLARVIGSVQSTVKHEVLENEKIMMLQPVSSADKKNGPLVLALDRVQAGPGDLVLYVDEGNSARAILENNQAPMRTIIFAIVDTIDQGNANG